jgi:hypothetical protein
MPLPSRRRSSSEVTSNSRTLQPCRFAWDLGEQKVFGEIWLYADYLKLPVALRPKGVTLGDQGKTVIRLRFANSKDATSLPSPRLAD